MGATEEAGSESVTGFTVGPPEVAAVCGTLPAHVDCC